MVWINMSSPLFGLPKVIKTTHTLQSWRKSLSPEEEKKTNMRK